jgi:hypothetical protein
MRATVVGNARNLSISCDNGDKRLLGDVHVEGRALVCEVFRDDPPNQQFPQNLEGFISIFAQGTEALRRVLVVRNLDSRYQTVIDRYKDLRNLTTFDIDGAKLFISVMLGAADFIYFTDFIERNFLPNCNMLWIFRFTPSPQTPKSERSFAQNLDTFCRQSESFNPVSHVSFQTMASRSALSI